MDSADAVRRLFCFAPLVARSRTTSSATLPAAYDCVRFAFVHAGSAVLLSESGNQHALPGDVIFIGPNVLCGVEPEETFTVSTVYLDTDYLLDQVFWQHAALLRDRLEAHDFAATIYTEPSQVIRLGEDRFRTLTPWLEELVVLSTEGRPVDTFLRMQALWFSVAHVIAPFLRIPQDRTFSTQHAAAWPSGPRIRQFRPLRPEIRRAADLLRSAPERKWSVTDIADAIHLSKSQVGRLFVEAFGKSPIAYLTMLRTERMAVLLRTTDAPIAVIAREVGWEDPDFAARQFRRSVGVTPSNYRALSRVQAQAAG